MSIRIRVGALALGLVLAVLALLSIATPAGAAVVLTASPAGTGTSCTASAPCSAVTALAKARPGDTVQLLGGSYGSPSLTGAGGTTAARITVRPVSGAAVTFAKLQTSVPNTTWTGAITVTSLLYVYPAAANTIVDGLTMRGAGSYLRGNGTIVRNSLFERGVGVDAVQIKNATGVVLERNTIRDYSVASTGEVHVDCVQIFDAAKVTLRRNSISNCSNAGVLLSPGAGLGIQGVVLEGNFIQGCVVVSTSCKGGSAIDVREPTATAVTVRGNTILDGATRVVPRPGLVFDRNVVEFLADCGAPLTNSIVQSWNTGSCATPAALGGNGNRQGSGAFVNADAGDLHVLDPASISVRPSTTSLLAAVIGYDGLALLSTTAGADD
jgi:hypothetical protein